MNGLVTNWRTSVTGVVLLGLGLAAAVFNLKIPGFGMEPGAAIIMGLGLLSAKDGNVTGGTVPVTVEAAKRTLGASVLGLALLFMFTATDARAADMQPAKARANVFAVDNSASVSLNGFYFGGSFAEAKTRGAFDAAEIKTSGPMVGAVVGYSVYADQFMLALEFDGNYGFEHDRKLCNAPAMCDMKPSWLLSQRVVIGLPMASLMRQTVQSAPSRAGQWPTAVSVPATLSTAGVMPYATFGIAERRFAVCVNPLACEKSMITGWIAGGGFRAPVSAGFSADVGYQYVNFGKNTDIQNPLFGAKSEQLMNVKLLYHM